MIATEDNVDDRANSDTKDHLASIVDGHKTKSKDTTFPEVSFAHFVLRLKLEKDGENENLEVDSNVTLKITLIQLQRFGSKLVIFQRRVRPIMIWRRRRKRSMRTTTKSLWNHKKKPDI